MEEFDEREPHEVLADREGSCKKFIKFLIIIGLISVFVFVIAKHQLILE